MRLLPIILLSLSGVAVGQTAINQSTISSTAPTYAVSISQPKEMVKILSQGPLLIEVTNAQGVITLQVNRDGTIKSSVGKLDDSAKLFWKLLAEYMPTICAQIPKVATK